METSLLSSDLPPIAAQTTVYALLVGINKYLNFPLFGPIGDVGKVADFLKSLPDVNLKLQLLTDENATKSGVIDAFQQHLGQAKPGDTALFYFSGHGTTEQADSTLWTDEPNGVLSSIACYNNLPNSWDYLLTDKELRFLLNGVSQAAGVHTVAVFDCCYSGNNTRSLLDLDLQDTRERSIPHEFPLRPWGGFFFSNHLSEAQARAQALEQWLPEPVHIQMAACEADEKALEINDEGVFTKNLLTVLQASDGAVSYESLIDRARQYMRFGYDQRPRLFVTGNEAETLKKRPFLNRQVSAELPAVQAQFDKSTQAWMLNVGALHGLQPGQTVGLLAADGTTLLTSPVDEVGLDYAKLTLAADASFQPNPAETYRVSVPGLFSQPLRIYLASRNGSPADQAKLITALVGEAGGCYLPEENEALADYALYARNGWYFLTLPNTSALPDNEYRPLVAPVSFTDETATQKLGKYIRQLAHWNYIKSLKNPAATGPGVTIDVTPEGGSTYTVPATDNDPLLLVPLIERVGTNQGEKTYQNEVTIKITNTTNQPLYCSVIYLSHGIGAMLQFLDINTLLQPNESALVGQNSFEGANNATRSSIPLSSSGEDVVYDYNWPAVDERLLFIFTTKSANASGQLSETTQHFLQIDELTKPPTLADRIKGDAKSIAPSRPSTNAPLPTWWTQSVNLRWDNPAYNKISQADLNAMIQASPNVPADDALADCALGLYFGVDLQQPATPRLRVKPELQRYWDGQVEGQRGLIDDITLTIASRVSQANRNRQFRENKALYPTRARIVATGDSWFQYPFLIRDIVDCLTNGYLVYSLSSTNTTLEDIGVDAVITAIDEADAQFLLFSGGLNDLMTRFADQFIHPVADKSPTDPHQYLTNAFFQTLDALQTRYELLFGVVQQKKPAVRIIAHGYDYIRSVNAVSPDRNWLAPQLAEKGIADPAAQQALLNVVIDEFNARLKKAADKFNDRATYLDLRNTVTKLTYWHDEIHPNDAGFLDLAFGFVKVIRASQSSVAAPAN